MTFYLYILESQTTGKLYIGQTNDLQDRIIRHNSDRNKYTKGKGPWILLFSKAFDTRAAAVSMEIKLKSWKNPTKVKGWIMLMNG
jgi:putative endonuclease